MKFGKYIEINEDNKKDVMDALKIDDPINKDYVDDEDNNKEAKTNIRDIKRSIRFQKKDIKFWENKRFSEDNVEAAEAILDDLQVSLKKWEIALDPPPEPEPEEEPGPEDKPKPEQPIPGEKGDEKEPEEEPEESDEERGAGIVNEI
jgi:hypothetical protein